jgi:hypothetical protein
MIKNRRTGGIVLVIVGFLLMVLTTFLKGSPGSTVGAVLMGIGVFVLITKPK